VTAPTWTLENELKGLAGRAELLEALRALGLLHEEEELTSLSITRDWYRSGAETYGLRFLVVTDSGRRNFFMKACVALPGAGSLGDVFDQWLSRRRLVESLGVTTPLLYATGPALLVEEYIPFTLSRALTTTDNHEALFRRLGTTAALVVNAGFVPISVHDWRSHGDDVVLVDFGQDLGPPGLAHGTESGLLSEILDNLARDGVALSATELKLLGSEYETSLIT
jgi:hypothetical protein